MFSFFSLFLVIAAPGFGSFAETAYRRRHAPVSDLLNRSRCNSCATRIDVLSLLPIFGFMLTRGRCGICKAKISPYYFLTECGFLIVAVWAFSFAPAAHLFPSILFGWSLVLLSRIDIETFTLPDALTLAVLFLALSVLPYDQPYVVLDRALGLFSGFILLWFVEMLYQALRGTPGLGRGDAKLLGALGLWVGFSGLPSVLLIASLSALLFVIFISLIQRSKPSGQSMIAFGPWLCLAGWLVWMHGPILLST